MEQNKTLSQEIGGTHYMQYKVQPIELINQCRWNFVQGNIAKYILRYKSKNGEEDLQKAEHYCFLADPTEKPQKRHKIKRNREYIEKFCEANNIDGTIKGILQMINRKDYMYASVLISDLYKKNDTDKQ